MSCRANYDDFYDEVNSAYLNVKCFYVSEDKIQINTPQMRIFFYILKLLNGIKLGLSIQKMYFLWVNMYVNTEDIFPCAQNINLTFGQTSQVSEIYISLEKIEKDALVELEKKILQYTLWW